MDANLLVRNFKNRLVKNVEESGLPAGVMLYIIKDVERELSVLYEQHCQIAQEKEKGEKENGNSVEGDKQD